MAAMCHSQGRHVSLAWLARVTHRDGTCHSERTVIVYSFELKALSFDQSSKF